MTHWILVRHGATDWNREGRQQGQADPPLNSEGEAQADQVARQLKGQTIDAVWSSDLSRALETANRIARVHGLKVRADSRLREVNQGAWEGLLSADIAASFPGELLALREHPLDARPPEGESVGELAERAMACVREIAALYADGSVVLVSHGLTLACLLCALQAIPLEEARQHIPDNCVPVELDWP